MARNGRNSPHFWVLHPQRSAPTVSGVSGLFGDRAELSGNGQAAKLKGWQWRLADGLSEKVRVPPIPYHVFLGFPYSWWLLGEYLPSPFSDTPTYWWLGLIDRRLDYWSISHNIPILIINPQLWYVLIISDMFWWYDRFYYVISHYPNSPGKYHHTIMILVNIPSLVLTPYIYHPHLIQHQRTSYPGAVSPAVKVALAWTWEETMVSGDGLAVDH